MTVAVVVKSVARFGCGEDLAETSAVLAVATADLEAIFADADASGSLGSIVTSSGISGFASTTIIRDAIAIVIKAIAYFGSRFGVPQTDSKFSVTSADLDAIFADALSAGIGVACVTSLGITELTDATVVYSAIAVVVEAIAADLCSRGFDLAEAWAKSGGSRCGVECADTDSIFAGPFVLRRCSPRITGLGGSDFTTTLFVDLAIAVVVEVIAADIRRYRQDLPEARAKSSFSALFASAELETRFANSLALCPLRAGITGARSSDNAACGAIVVDLAVAVVVQTIADLGAREDRALARAKEVFSCLLVGDTHLDSSAARGVFVGSGGASIARSRIARDAGFLTIFVDAAIAVVVKAITQRIIGGGLDSPLAWAECVSVGLCVQHAKLHPRSTSADTTFAFGSRFVITRARCIRQAAFAIVVDLAVAIVVEAIADLGRCGRHFTDASTPRTTATDLITVSTDPFVAFFVGSCGRTGFDVTAATRAASLVDLAVAVVIKTVATFGCGALLSTTLAPTAILARLNSHKTRSNALGIGRPGITLLRLALLAKTTIVRDAVAVVVKPVPTDFLNGRDLGFARAKTTVGASAHPRFAQTCALKLPVGLAFASDGVGVTRLLFALFADPCGTVGQIFVDVSVAIVIHTIASFGRRKDLRFTSPPLAIFVAALEAGCAASLVQNVLLICGDIITGDSLAGLFAVRLTTIVCGIDQAVTVVIFTVVALLGSFGRIGAFFFDDLVRDAISPQSVGEVVGLAGALAPLAAFLLIDLESEATRDTRTDQGAALACKGSTLSSDAIPFIALIATIAGLLARKAAGVCVGLPCVALAALGTCASARGNEQSGDPQTQKNHA